MTTGQQANSRDGKPLNVGDNVTLIGTITAISGYGPGATITVTLAYSGSSINAEALDCAASQQTL